MTMIYIILEKHDVLGIFVEGAYKTMELAVKRFEELTDQSTLHTHAPGTYVRSKINGALYRIVSTTLRVK